MSYRMIAGAAAEDWAGYAYLPMTMMTQHFAIIDDVICCGLPLIHCLSGRDTARYLHWLSILADVTKEISCSRNKGCNTNKNCKCAWALMSINKIKFTIMDSGKLSSIFTLKACNYQLKA